MQIGNKIKVRYKISDQKTVLIIGFGMYDCWWRLRHACPVFESAPPISCDDFEKLPHVPADDNDPVGIWQDDDKPVVSDLSAGTCEGMAAMMLIDSLTKLEIEPGQRIKIQTMISWQPCDDCDLPDACCDFGCAIRKGLKEPKDW